MKKFTLLLSVFTLSLATPVFAEESAVITEQSVKAGDVQVSVNGLVCDFCARALEKVFGKQEAVENINVNLDTKIITVNFKEGQNLDDETIKTLIQDAGYNVESIAHE